MLLNVEMLCFADFFYSVSFKNLGTKSQELTNLKFSGRLFVSESISNENQQLAYKCRQLKSARKIHSTWFFNNL